MVLESEAAAVLEPLSWGVALVQDDHVCSLLLVSSRPARLAALTDALELLLQAAAAFVTEVDPYTETDDQ